MGNQDHWELSGTKSLREFRTLSVQERTYLHRPTGQEKQYAVCDSADWVFVIPIRPDQQVVFIHQFRHGLGEVVLEIPGGVMDPGETPEQTAVRELREETGYVPGSLEIVGPLIPNPGLNTARYYVAVARDCEPVHEPSPEPFEEIEIELRPLDSVTGMIRSGELQHALCIAAFASSGIVLKDY